MAGFLALVADPLLVSWMFCPLQMEPSLLNQNASLSRGMSCLSLIFLNLVVDLGTKTGAGWLVRVSTSVVSGDCDDSTDSLRISESFDAAAAFTPPTGGSFNFVIIIVVVVGVVVVDGVGGVDGVVDVVGVVVGVVVVFFSPGNCPF